ncbi:MAG: hypothetical protein EOP56_19305 [Sphingobacteriales bacterium]|nr:MAG: hypothetical protein EOP56_19305 [Sphingobacteriales bacterium]
MEPQKQDVKNLAAVEKQVNVNNLTGNINFSNLTRLGQRFKRLKEEVDLDIRYNGFIEAFHKYDTQLDGRSMPEKLRDGGFTEKDISRATYRKHLYVKKLEKSRLYETAQLIDLDIFAIINSYFEVYIEPLIEANTETATIKQHVLERIVNPILHLINQDGQDDALLNYSIDDIYGMIFFLTGKCHLNWADYDNIQPGI